jgi:phosphopantetheinyl transferase
MYPIIVLGQGKNNTVIQKILTFIKQREKRRIYRRKYRRRKYRRRKKDLRNLQMVYHHVKPELDDDVTNIISSYL